MQSLEMNLDSAPLRTAPEVRDGELRRSAAAPILTAIYRMLHGERRWKVSRRICSLLLRLEGKGWRSGTVRDLLRRYHQVDVGAYSYGECMIPGIFPPGVVVGRYTSIAAGVRVFNQNHPLDQLSMHPYFYESQLGVIERNHLSRRTLTIGHDVWIGQSAIITPGCSRVGIGAVIGAGAVVTKDVDDFAIVAGNPAKLIRHRFSEPMRKSILQSRWWERSIDDLAEHVDLMTRPLTESDMDHLARL
jgi:acetyltransferase-like isoleucine patch superfamily enzyme